MRHKVMVVDDSIVVTGFFTNSADKENDDSVIIIYSPVIAQRDLDEYNRVSSIVNDPNSSSVHDHKASTSTAWIDDFGVIV
jgi:phosphatidylserine/phosphatidylglycerophosphate/cardiolipin synthase-like enzyme